MRSAEERYASDLSKIVESRFEVNQHFVLTADLPRPPIELDVDDDTTRPKAIMLRVSSPEQRIEGDSPYEQLEELVPSFARTDGASGASSGTTSPPETTAGRASKKCATGRRTTRGSSSGT